MLEFQLTNYYGQDLYYDIIDARPLEDRMKSAKEEKERDYVANYLAHSIIDYTIDWNIENNIDSWTDEEMLNNLKPLKKELMTHDLEFLKHLEKEIDESPTNVSSWLFHDVYMKGLSRWTFQGFRDEYEFKREEIGNNIIETIQRIKQKGKQMMEQKFETLDELLSAMEDIVSKKLTSYYSDYYDWDMPTLQRESGEYKYVWLVRDTGTWLIKQDNAQLLIMVLSQTPHHAYTITCENDELTLAYYGFFGKL